MAVDTGATHTFVDTAIFRYAGYSPEASSCKTMVATGGGEVYAPVLSSDCLEVLGIARKNFPVTAISLPASASVDGVIGLDFMRGHVVTFDFCRGKIRFE